MLNRTSKVIVFCTTIFLVVGLVACRNRNDTISESKGIGGDADGNTQGKLYLYTVENGVVNQWLCPNSRPILRSNCQQTPSPRAYDSFEKELRAMVQRDLSKTQTEVKDYTDRANEFTKLIEQGGPDTADLVSQRESIYQAIKSLQEKLRSIEAEQVALADTLEKLKSNTVDYEITKDSLLYQNNRSSFQRFQDVMATSAAVITCSADTGAKLCGRLNIVNRLLSEGCGANCERKIMSESYEMAFISDDLPRAWEKYTVGSDLGELAKKTATAIQRKNWSNGRPSLLKDWANSANMACRAVIALQNAAPSLKSKSTSCTKSARAIR